MTDKILIDRAVVEQALEALREAEMLMERFQDEKLRRFAMEALRAALEQPVEQEPIAWANINKHGDITHTSNKKMAWAKTPIYTNPQPPRQPLTDEQIGEIEDMFSNEFGLEAKHAVDFARAIERAHGIIGE